MNLLQAQDATTAKRFLINRVVEQALTDRVLLSDIEKTMLGFSEPTATPAEMEAAESFEREYDAKKYEAKVAKLLRRAHNRDKKSGDTGSWRRALAALNEDDCYLLVMVEQAGIKIPGRWRVIVKAFLNKLTIAMGVVGLCGWVFFFPIRNISPIPLRVYVIHSDLLTVVLFAVWIAALWLIGDIFRRMNISRR